MSKIEDQWLTMCWEHAFCSNLSKTIKLRVKFWICDPQNLKIEKVFEKSVGKGESEREISRWERWCESATCHLPTAFGGPKKCF